MQQRGMLQIGDDCGWALVIAVSILASYHIFTKVARCYDLIYERAKANCFCI